MLQEILDYHVPDTWQQSTYTGKRYEMVDLLPGDLEYQQVTAPFETMEIERVVRLQNPYIYGRFKIRKEYLALSSSVCETTEYHPVAAADVVKVADHNCDTRRYTAPHSSQQIGKNPRFYGSPQQALERFRAYGSAGSAAIIVVKLLNGDNAWDSQYQPEYVVYLQ